MRVGETGGSGLQANWAGRPEGVLAEVAVLLEREKPKPKFGIMPRPPVNETGPGSTTGDAAKKPPVESKVLLPSPFD